jgi:hypothetical protein
VGNDASTIDAQYGDEAPYWQYTRDPTEEQYQSARTWRVFSSKTEALGLAACCVWGGKTPSLEAVMKLSFALAILSAPHEDREVYGRHAITLSHAGT